MSYASIGFQSIYLKGMRHFKWNKVISTKQRKPTWILVIKTCLMMIHVCVWFFSMLLYYHNNSCNKPLASINWNQKEPLDWVVYSHCPINDSYNDSTHSCCLPCHYVTKPFGILQKVIKSQRMHISEKSLKLLSNIYFFTK